MIDRRESTGTEVGPFDEATHNIGNPCEPITSAETLFAATNADLKLIPCANEPIDVEPKAMPTKQILSNDDSSVPTMTTMLIGTPPTAAAGSATTASSNMLSAVEELVYEIKENLRLKARPSAVHSSRAARPSPYHIPCRSWSDSATACDKQTLLNRHHQRKTASSSTTGSSMMADPHGGPLGDTDQLDDPYEMLQTLLKSNNLVKEAVRRLQLNYNAMGGVAGDESSSPKPQRFFYDSDDEPGVRSPVMRMCQLEL